MVARRATKEKQANLNVLHLGLAVGIAWGLGFFLISIAAWITGWGSEFIALTSSVYVGISATLMGSVIGAVWGFVDGFIGGAVIAFLYNLFQNKQ